MFQKWDNVLKNHSQRCKKYLANVDQKQTWLSFQTKRDVKENGSIELVNVPSYWKFDLEFSRKELAKMIIIDEFFLCLLNVRHFMIFA